jgi:hypothetical protein
MRWMTGASKEPPPPTTLGAPRERGCPLQSQKHGRSYRTSSTLQHHSPGDGPGDCDLQLHWLAQVDSWLGQLGTRHDDDEAVKRSAVGNAWAGWVSISVFFSLDGRSPVSHPTCEVPFPPIRSGPPVVPGGLWIPNPRKSGSVIGADRQRFGPSCVLLKRVPQGRTESGGIVLAGPRVPSGGVTLKNRCTYRPSVIYLIVNKLLSLSLPLSLTCRPRRRWCNFF